MNFIALGLAVLIVLIGILSLRHWHYVGAFGRMPLFLKSWRQRFFHGRS